MKNHQVEKLTVYSRCTCSTYYRIRNHRSKTGPKNMKPHPSRKNGHGLISLPRENEPRLHLLAWKNNSGPVFPRTGKILYPVREGKL